MTTLDLIHIVLKTRLIRDAFIGVYPSDKIYTLVNDVCEKAPCFAIVNRDPSYLKGSHWIALYITRDSVTYLCPQAEDPTEQFYSVLATAKKKIYVNRKKIQPNKSTVCGLYCICYIILRQLGLCDKCSLEQFQKLTSNDKYVVDMCAKFSTSPILQSIETRDTNLGREENGDKGEICKIAVWSSKYYQPFIVLHKLRAITKQVYT